MPFWRKLGFVIIVNGLLRVRYSTGPEVLPQMEQDPQVGPAE